MLMEFRLAGYEMQRLFKRALKYNPGIPGPALATVLRIAVKSASL